MSQVGKEMRVFLAGEEGASMGEYALLLGVITVALIAVVGLFKNQVANLFNSTTNTLSNSGN